MQLCKVYVTLDFLMTKYSQYVPILDIYRHVKTRHDPILTMQYIEFRCLIGLLKTFNNRPLGILAPHFFSSCLIFELRDILNALTKTLMHVG